MGISVRAALRRLTACGLLRTGRGGDHNGGYASGPQLSPLYLGTPSAGPCRRRGRRRSCGDGLASGAGTHGAYSVSDPAGDGGGGYTGGAGDVRGRNWATGAAEAVALQGHVAGLGLVVAAQRHAKGGAELPGDSEVAAPR